VVRLPVAFLLAFGLGWGSRGAYVGMVAGNVVSALIGLWLFLSGRWQRALVAPLSGDDRGQQRPEG
jgi:Na+-driven multidrug efflux pump